MSGYLFSIAIVFLFILPIPLSCLHTRYRLKREADSIFAAVMNASDYGQILFDSKGALLMMNDLAEDEFCRIMDWDGEDVTRSSFLDYLYDHAVDYDESIKNTILSHFDTDSNAPEFREVIRYGGEFLYVVNARKLENEMTLFTIVDISAGQQREEKLQHLDMLNYQLLQAVQASSTGIVISDPKKEGNPILFANDAFCSFTDSDLDELSEEGWRVLSPFFPDEHEHEKFLMALLDCSETELDLEDVRDLKSGEKRYYALTFSPVYLGEELDLVIGLLADVTLFRQRDAELFKAQRLESLGGLAAGIAHDFNNILSIISGYCSMLERGSFGADDGEKGYLKKINTAAQRGADLTRKMLTFSSHKVVEKVTLNLCVLVEEHAAFLNPLLGANINMELILPEEGCEKGVFVRGGVSSVEQILMNLVVNARDVMADGGDLKISLSCFEKSNVPKHVQKEMGDVDLFACLRVSDTGLGMEKEILERIFDPFFTTKEQGKGTGLGLSVVYGLVKELGGFIDVETKLGRGTCMSVYMPRSEDNSGSRVISGDADLPETIRLEGYTVLVAEDEPDLLKVVSYMLEDLGMQVLSAPNGADALVCQDDFEGKIDVLLTDVLMPEVDGVKLAELLTSLRPDTKVVFMSGFPARGDMAPLALPEGAVFITKPLVYETLAQMLYYTLTCDDIVLKLQSKGVDVMPHWEKTDDVVGGQG